MEIPKFIKEGPRCSFRPTSSTLNSFNAIICSILSQTFSQQCIKQELIEEIQAEQIITPKSSRCGYRSISLINTAYQESYSTIPLKEEPSDSIIMSNSASFNAPADGQTNTFVERPKRINKTKLKKQLLLEDPEKKQLMEEYAQVKHQNSLKNIRDAFLKHVNSPSLSQTLKETYVELMGGNHQFGQIKKKINMSLKENSTNNKCIKFMCRSSQVQPIFAYFLENIEVLWLAESKVQNKDTTRAVVKLLLKFIDDTSAIDLIEHYHTKQ